MDEETDEKRPYWFSVRDPAVLKRFDDFFARLLDPDYEHDPDNLEDIFREFLDIVYLVPPDACADIQAGKLCNILLDLPPQVRATTIECDAFYLAYAEFFFTRKIDYLEKAQERCQARAEVARGALAAVREDIADGLLREGLDIERDAANAVEEADLELSKTIAKLAGAQRDCTSLIYDPDSVSTIAHTSFTFRMCIIPLFSLRASLPRIPRTRRRSHVYLRSHPMARICSSASRRAWPEW